MCGHNLLSNRLLPWTLLSAIGFLTPLPSSAAQPDVRQQIDALTAATSLDRTDMQPWHMKLSFDLFNLNGKPQESGTIEEWWAGADRARIVITSPSFNQALPGDDPAVHGREAYLVHLLLREIVHPMIRENADQFVAIVAPRTFGQTSLSCTTLNLKNADNTQSDQFCTDPGTGALRLTFFQGVRSDALNDVSSALGTQVAMMHTIAYLGHPAIKGHIESIESFDAAHSTLQLGAVAPSQTGTIAPQLLTRISPIYPRPARESGQSGFAVLHFHILPNGRVSPIDIIGSSGPAFTDASTDAVRRWGYIPMKRNGSAAESESTLTITFLPKTKNSDNLQVLMHEDVYPE